ncbi:MAG TPA: ATP synthase F1 subunit delta [Actinomycetota bacterium]|nr:ATP synthase F1 subunit delta [Actinomycetota bacterium]
MATEEVVEGYAQALYSITKAEGETERVEREAFQLRGLLEKNHELGQALGDPSISTERREELLAGVLGDKVSPQTKKLVGLVVEQGRGRQLASILARLSDLVAESKGSVVAEVRSAIPLDTERQQALAAALTKVTGKKVEVKVIVDESVLGGLVTKIGDTIIDGTVRRRLELLKEQVR